MTDSLSTELFSSLASLLFQLETADDDQVNSDFAVSLMEAVGAKLGQLKGRDMADLIALTRDLADAAPDGAWARYLEGFPNNFGLSDH